MEPFEMRHVIVGIHPFLRRGAAFTKTTVKASHPGNLIVEEDLDPMC